MANVKKQAEPIKGVPAKFFREPGKRERTARTVGRRGRGGCGRRGEMNPSKFRAAIDQMEPGTIRGAAECLMEARELSWAHCSITTEGNIVMVISDAGLRHLDRHKFAGELNAAIKAVAMRHANLLVRRAKDRMRRALAKKEAKP